MLNKFKSLEIRWTNNIPIVNRVVSSMLEEELRHNTFARKGRIRVIG